jgi:ankyrin repeat protein
MSLTTSKPAISAGDIARLVKAAGAGKVDSVRSLLDGGVPPEAVDESGYSALLLACEKARPEVVTLLLERGASVDSPTRDRSTPLVTLLASLRRNAPQRDREARGSIAEVLLERGASVDIPGWKNRTALWYAAREGDLGLVSRMLPRARSLLATSSDGYTLLHMAAICGHLDLARGALAAGIAVDAREENGGTPLFHAAFYGDLAMCTLLLASGADPNAATKHGWTPLHRAAACESPVSSAISGAVHGGATRSRAAPQDVIRLLFDEGAVLDARDDEGMTPRDRAAERGKPSPKVRVNGPTTVEVIDALLALTRRGRVDPSPGREP